MRISRLLPALAALASTATFASATTPVDGAAPQRVFLSPEQLAAAEGVESHAYQVRTALPELCRVRLKLTPCSSRAV